MRGANASSQIGLQDSQSRMEEGAVWVPRVPELALPCSQIDDYLKCDHRTFIQQLMEAEAEIHSGALG